MMTTTTMTCCGLRSSGIYTRNTPRNDEGPSKTFVNAWRPSKCLSKTKQSKQQQQQKQQKQQQQQQQQQPPKLRRPNNPVPNDRRLPKQDPIGRMSRSSMIWFRSTAVGAPRTNASWLGCGGLRQDRTVTEEIFRSGPNLEGSIVRDRAGKTPAPR